MVDGKSIALVSAVMCFAVALGDVIDAHKSVSCHFAVTNTTDKLQTVEDIRASCACLKVVADTGDAIQPGEVLPIEVVFNPAGMEGHVAKSVFVTLSPSKKVEKFTVAADVRLRLGFKPMDATFGVIRRSETGREIVAKLSGYATDGVKLGEPILAAKNAKDAKNVFDVRVGADGKSLVAKFRERNVLPGIYSETWTIPTSDPEISEISFPVSARVADAVSVAPQVITVGWDEPVCSRMVMVRDEDLNRKDHKDVLKVISAETMPRKWGDVKITPRPMNGWRIDIENIDPVEVRQFSKRPFLEVKTNLPGMESFEIPLRVVNDGGMK